MARRVRAKPSEVMAAAKIKAERFDVAELLSELIAEFGGLREFAKEYAKEFRATRSGSISKSKLLDGILRLVTQATARQGVDRTIDHMSDDELAASLVAELKDRQVIVEDAEGGDAEPPVAA